MEKFSRRFNRLGIIVLLLCLTVDLCCSLNTEGLALLKLREKVVNDPYGALLNWIDSEDEFNHCSWFGVHCSSNRNVVALNLKDLGLQGTLPIELRNLVHINSIILRNNSFEGTIPEGFGELMELEVLDLGFNNFSGETPHDLGSNLSLAILLLDNNDLLGGLSPEMYELQLLSECQVDEELLSNVVKETSCHKGLIEQKFAHEDNAHRRLLQSPSRMRYWNPYTKLVKPPSSASKAESPSPAFIVESPSPFSSGSADPSITPTPNKTSPSPKSSASPHAFAPSSTTTSAGNFKTSHNKVAVLCGAIGGGLLIVFAVFGAYLYRTNKVSTVKPWATGLSGQLSKAFITGVPKLKRAELETACEDFSNVIGSSPIGTVYKGTLSNGVEIAVASVEATTTNDWSVYLESQFRKKIDTLSKVNHKNFVNLLGFCEQEEPFTRMLVFEYAPNGTLFEHLHIKESEHLDWGMRLRITMGMAYCLEHMHQLDPPIAHTNLTSSSVKLSEDYAAKVSDLGFWSEMAAAEIEVSSEKISEMPLEGPESNVYSFGVTLFEMMTGRIPYMAGTGSLSDWASDYLRGEQPLIEMVDPSLASVDEEKLESIGEVIRSCVNPNPEERPTMNEVTGRLKQITGMAADGAVPKLSPLWWAELEILATEAS
ncbi:hypothetical protein ACFE04_031127 [Oxalis oulophora]